MGVERIQAPSGGLNSDAAPDYMGADEATILGNFLPGTKGRVIARGRIDQGVLVTSTASNLTALWTLDDVALLLLANGTTNKVDLAALTTSDVSGSVTETMASSVHTRYGASVYGAIADAANPALALWTGNGVLTQQTNAPYGFVDVHAYAKRLWTLGGSVPGTTTPIKKYSLFYTDPNPDANLALTASWTDDTSGLINQIVYDADDSPVAFATAGRFLAILGSRSINILTGTGSSSFAITNLTREYGCIERGSIVETSAGFYFLTDRGLAFCDGTDVRLVTPGKLQQTWLRATNTSGVHHTATLFKNGYLGLTSNDGLAATYDTGLLLLHLDSMAWTIVHSTAFNGPVSLHHSLSYPLIYDGKSLYLGNRLTNPWTLVGHGGDLTSAGGGAAVDFTYKTRQTKLTAPFAKAIVQYIVFDYVATFQDPFVAGVAPTHAWEVTVADETDTVLGTFTPDFRATSSDPRRQRARFDINGEANSITLTVRYLGGTTASIKGLEVMDAWVVFEAGYQPPGF